MDDKDIEVVIVPAQTHVPEVERFIRVIKERFRALYHHLPYSTMPGVMVDKAVTHLTKWLNCFPVKGGMSPYYSPRTILLKRVLIMNNIAKQVLVLVSKLLMKICQLILLNLGPKVAFI